MTYRELLELAAKSIDLNYDPTVESKHGLYCASHEDQGNTFYWNPLRDDGDALRLAVQLGITAIQDKLHRVCAAYWTDCMCCNEPYLDDEFAATRRAITRAAAQIQLDKEKK